MNLADYDLSYLDALMFQCAFKSDTSNKKLKILKPKHVHLDIVIKFIDLKMRRSSTQAPSQIPRRYFKLN